MYVLTSWHPDFGESHILAVSKNPETLEAFAASVFEADREGSECKTDELVWVWGDQEAEDQWARVDWGWGSDEVYRIQPVDVI